MKNQKLTFVFVVVLFIALVLTIGLGWYTFNNNIEQIATMKDEQAYLAKKLSRHSATLDGLNNQLMDIERMAQQDRIKSEDIVNKIAVMKEAIQSCRVTIDEMDNKISNSKENMNPVKNKVIKQSDVVVGEVNLGGVSINKGVDKSASEEKE